MTTINSIMKAQAEQKTEQFNKKMSDKRRGVIKAIFYAHEKAGVSCNMEAVKRLACNKWANVGFNDITEEWLERIYREWCVISKIVEFNKMEGVHPSNPIAYAVEIICHAARRDEINEVTDGDLNRISYEWRKKRDVKEIRTAYDYLHADKAAQN